MSIFKSLTVSFSAIAVVAGLAGFTYSNAGHQDAAAVTGTSEAAFVADQDAGVADETGDATDAVDDRFFADSPRARFTTRRKKSAYQKALETLKDSDSDEDRDEAIAAIRTELEKQYDEFLDQNKQELERMQERLDKLRDQLERRRQAKDRMVELRLETVIGEAEGLIWPTDRRTNTFWRVAPPAASPAVPGRANFPAPAATTVPRPAVPGFRPRRSDRTR